MPEKSIGRVRYPNIRIQTEQEYLRAYRFPVPLVSSRDSFTLAPADASAERRIAVPMREALAGMQSLDVSCIAIRARSRYIRIKLVRDQRIIDYGNRWDRIEALFTSTFNFEVRIIEPHRWFKW